MTSRVKKPAFVASREFTRLFGQLSKAALIDTLWCACQLGTDESPPEIAVQAARNAVIALRFRGDRVPKDVDVLSHSDQRIDSGA